MYARLDDTFGNRYDDPLGEYRVLYAASQRGAHSWRRCRGFATTSG
jgi:hypothetical protein